MMTGFDDAEWRTRARGAISMLRAAAEAVRNGDETPCMTGPGIYDFSEPREVRLDDYWNASDQFRRVLSLSRIEAEALRQKFPAPSAAAQASSPAASSSGPRFPRGTVFTRPLTGSTT